MKRIFLFLATNLAVILVMSIVLSLLGVNRYLYGTGLNLGNMTGLSYRLKETQKMRQDK